MSNDTKFLIFLYFRLAKFTFMVYSIIMWIRILWQSGGARVDNIQTTRNKTYKYIRSLKQKKSRSAENRFTVEGEKSVSEAVRAGKSIYIIAVSETFYKSSCFNYPDGVRTVVVMDELFPGLCDTVTPQGILAVIDLDDKTDFMPDSGRFYVYCDNISDPGNLGTIIRTADAAGAGGVLLSPGCADLYSPKTVRSSMGSFFNIDIWTDIDINMLLKMKESGFSLFSGALRKDSGIYTEKDYTVPAVIIVGNEANGVSEEILDISEHIIIPIAGGAESLNAAVAAAVIMYEAVRQRRAADHDK